MKLRIIYILGLLVNAIVQAQAPIVNYIPAITKSPQTYEFERYGNVPVNLFAGSIDLGIPIFSGKVQNSSVNVGLTYNSSGFLPAKKSNYTGYNWSLVYGGAITREVKGIPDDYNSDGNGAMGFLYTVKNLPQSNSNGYNGGYSNYFSVPTVNINGYQSEIQPDKFSFNFNGISGYFYIGTDGKPIVSSNIPNLKISLDRLNYQYYNAGCEPGLSGFTIKDGEGNEYYFGDDVENMEISYYLGHHLSPSSGGSQFASSSYSISAWYLYKIKYANKETLKISYKKRPLFYPAQFQFCNRWNALPIKTQFSNNSQQFYDLNLSNNQRNEGYSYSYSYVNSDAYTGSGSGYNATAPHYNIEVTKKVIPETIEVENRFSINFKYKTQTASEAENFNAFLLDSIIVKNKSAVVDKFKFNYQTNSRDYYFLQSVIKNNNDKYQLDYSSTDSLPKFNTFGIDYWGYWNGGNATTNQLIPNYRINLSNGDFAVTGTSRETNAGLFNTAQLSKITYPTGGYSIFEYEPHYYSQKVAKTSITDFFKQVIPFSGYSGGARIKKITSFDGINFMIKEYKYIKDFSSASGGVSSGILYNDYRMVEFIDNGYKTNQSSLSSKNIIEKSTNIDNSSLSSYNVAYSEVSEMENGELKKKYLFSDYITNPDSLIYKQEQYPTFYNNVNPYTYQKNFDLKYLVKDNERGKIVKEILYKDGNSIVRENSFYYNSLKTNSLLANNYTVFIDGALLWRQTYKMYGLPYVMVKSVIKEYLNTSSVETKNEYLYESNSHLNLSRQKSFSLDGEVLETKYQYAYEKSNQILIDSNRVSIPLEIQVLKKKNVNDPGNLISKTETAYPTSLPTSQAGNLLFPLQSNSYDLQNNMLSTEVSYDKYDEKGNIMQYTTKDGVSTSIIWGYDKTKPIAKIEGTKIYDIPQSLIDSIVNASNTDAISGTDASEQSLITALDAFRNNAGLSAFQISTYTYDPLIGVRSITPPSGIREFYKYDAANRLEKVVDANGKVLKEYQYHYKN